VLERQARTKVEAFVQANDVFSLDEAVTALRHPRGKDGVRNSLAYYLRLGRLKSVTRGVYASVLPGTDPATFQPDRYLVAAKARPDAVFAYHAALELLGAAHSDWSVCAAFTGARRKSVTLGSVRLVFFPHPASLERSPRLATRQVERGKATLVVTGPERTLLDGLRRPELAGGPLELVESAAGFGVLDLDLLRKLLKRFDEKLLWAAAGWFLERYRQRFFVNDAFLAGLERQRPRSPQYLVRSQRGGTMARRWNLILPANVAGAREPDER
jgi:predicted transcriptional regulator of viral defense system